MNNLIAKRYVKALVKGRDGKALNSIYGELKTISQAFTQEKFVSIICSTQVKNNDKIDLLISFVDNCSDDLRNLLKLLGFNKRINLIPEIANELYSKISIMDNTYTGVVYTNKQLSSDYMSLIEKQFSKKFSIKLSLSQNICDYDGIKVDIDSLGIEISFSKHRFKTQMINHVLKAV